MTNPGETVNKLLRQAAKNSGATPEEAHTAARIALKLARKHHLGGHTVVRCLNMLFKTETRRFCAAA